MADVGALPKAPTDVGTQERFRGCLLGGAVGDALGAAVNSMTRAEILARFGDSGIRDYAPAFGRRGAITAHTQMCLFTAEGMLRGWVRFNMRGIGPVFESTTAYAYVRWLVTQGYQPNRSALVGEAGWLIEHRDLFSQRSPGESTVAALRALHSSSDKATNSSKGCGAITRVAPVGMFMASWVRQSQEHIQTTFDVAAGIAAVTHGHPTAHCAAGTLALTIALVLAGSTLAEAVIQSKSELRRHDGHDETLKAIEAAELLARRRPDCADGIDDLGHGWVAEEALAIALYCALCARDFESGVCAAVNHGGDSDATGLIAGNLLGCLYGRSRISERWMEALELRALVEEVADDLATCRDWRIGEFEFSRENEFYNRRYPPN